MGGWVGGRTYLGALGKGTPLAVAVTHGVTHVENGGVCRESVGGWVGGWRRKKEKVV